ncbi:MAG: Gfo/Idh/MocA family oxidoreductase [Clostridia bacterium]|nr:Gfo/Idh/MocA family oxidoreductase [Clostridia bacterium]
MEKLIRVAVIGCGGRGMYSYAPYVKQFENAEITAVAEPIAERREFFAETYHLKPENCFETAEEFFAQPKMAEVVFICTQDRQHYAHTIAALKKGYDILLEKPVSNLPENCIDIANTAKRLGRKVMVCHVLRYTPFYQKIKEAIQNGEIGQVMSLHQFEDVGWGHYAHSFVRGLWRNSDETSPMILAKCCHDMDIILWLIGSDCQKVSSFGTLSHFVPENAPIEGDRCTKECPKYDSCPYCADKVYHNPKWAWAQQAVVLNPNEEKLQKALSENKYGRCVYRCDNNVVDHQIVNLQFEGGVTASLTMCAFTNEMTREIKIMGTRGEIIGNMEENTVTIKRFGEEPEVIDIRTIATDLSGHGGGENKMVRDLFAMVRGTDNGAALTSIDKSIQSHIMAFASERSRVEGGRVVELEEIYKEHTQII